MSACKVHSRREFLVSLGAVGSAAILLPACEYVSWHGAAADLPFDFDVGQSTYAALATVGGMVSVTKGSPIVLIRVSQQVVTALSGLCPHQQYSLAPQDFGSWDKDKLVLTCLAHGSQFGADGHVVAAPATTGLLQYVVKFDAASGKGTVSAPGSAGSDAGNNDAASPASDTTSTSDAGRDGTFEALAARKEQA